jgi:hypothetical protein
MDGSMGVWACNLPVLVAARSRSEADTFVRRVARDRPEFVWSLPATVWRELDDDEPLTIADPDTAITKNAATWASEDGPGVLCLASLDPSEPMRGRRWIERQIAATQ